MTKAQDSIELTCRESCGSCGADLGPSSVFTWHYQEDDCRAQHDPLTTVEAEQFMRARRSKDFYDRMEDAEKEAFNAETKL